MKKSLSNKDQPPKKVNAKDKSKENQKKVQKEQKKHNNDDISEEEYEEYTQEEIKLLDKYHEFTNHKLEDHEIYDVMMKFNSDDQLVKNELKQMLKDFSKGDEYNWQEIGKSE